MEKIKIGSSTLFPAPVTIIGTKAKNNKLNFATFSWIGIINSEPPMIGLSVRKTRLTHKNIIETKVFSVNIPSSLTIKETDYCGIVSGKEINKMDKCNFHIYYGNLKNIPMIEECPINMECKVKQIINLPSHDYFISEIIETYINDELYSANEIKCENIDSFIYLKKCYKKLGANLGSPYKIGLDLK